MRGHTPKGKGKNFMLAQDSHITGHPHKQNFEATDYLGVGAQMNMPGFIDKLSAQKERFKPINMDPAEAVLKYSDAEYTHAKSRNAEKTGATKKPLSKAAKTGKKK